MRARLGIGLILIGLVSGMGLISWLVPRPRLTPALDTGAECVWTWNTTVYTAPKDGFCPSMEEARDGVYRTKLVDGLVTDLFHQVYGDRYRPDQ